MDYKLNLTTAPTAEPVTLAEWKTYANIGTSDTTTAQDSYIEDILIVAARQMVERYLNRALINQTWTMTFDFSPSKVVFPWGQLSSVTSVYVLNDDGTSTLQSSDLYNVNTGDGGQMQLVTGSAWSSTTKPSDVFQVAFVAGYGAAASSVPELIINGIYRVISYMWENRESDISTLLEVPFVSDFLYPYKIWEL